MRRHPNELCHTWVVVSHMRRHTNESRRMCIVISHVRRCHWSNARLTYEWVMAPRLRHDSFVCDAIDPTPWLIRVFPRMWHDSFVCDTIRSNARGNILHAGISECRWCHIGARGVRVRMCVYIIHADIHNERYTHMNRKLEEMIIVQIQPIAFRVSFHLNLQSHSDWALFNETRQKRPWDLENRSRIETEEMTPQMHYYVCVCADWVTFEGEVCVCVWVCVYYTHIDIHKGWYTQ